MTVTCPAHTHDTELRYATHPTAWAGLDVQRDTSPPSALFSFPLNRNVDKRTKPLLAAKTSLVLP